MKGLLVAITFLSVAMSWAYDWKTLPRYRDTLLEMAYLGNEAMLRKVIMESESIGQIRLNLALQIASETASQELEKPTPMSSHPEDIDVIIETPYFSRQTRWIGVIKALVAAGANPKAKNSKGKSSIELAEHPKIKELLVRLSPP